VCLNALFGRDFGEFNAGDEDGTGSPMVFGMNRSATSVDEILFEGANPA